VAEAIRDEVRRTVTSALSRIARYAVERDPGGRRGPRKGNRSTAAISGASVRVLPTRPLDPTTMASRGLKAHSRKPFESAHRRTRCIENIG
jgi:hypothetical protein